MTDDVAAFAAVYQRHLGAVSRYVARRCPIDDVADVVADVFTVAWRRRAVIPDEPETKAWLLGVSRFTLANYHRRFHRRGRLVRAVGDELRPRLEAGISVGPVDDVTDVTAAMSRLSSEDREILTLVAWDQLSVAEAASVVGVEAGTARKRLQRARQRLRVEIESGEAGGMAVSGARSKRRSERGNDRRAWNGGYGDAK